jgi:predicted ATPase/Tfp pilus assembly protein PilF
MKGREHPLAPATPLAPSPVRIESGVRARLARANLGNLGPPDTRFVGRRREMSELRTLLVEHRLVTVLGPAGVGKTRLATELARALLDGFGSEGGAWRVDLSEARDVDSACAAIARTLSVNVTSGGRSATTALGSAIASRPATLVILDAADGCAPFLGRALAEWSSAAPDVRWLVTAEARVGVEGEAVLDLAPLGLVGAVPDAVTLFLERARSARQDLELTDRREVQDLVRRLAGVPLAIELAAAWSRTLTTKQIGQVLQHADPQHTVVRSTFDRSWELLEVQQREALAQLSVFAGGFDVEAAQAVLDLSAYRDNLAVTELLEGLRDRSLLTATPSAEDDADRRFSMHRSLREYARERLAGLGGREGAIMRHARHYAVRGARSAELHDERGVREATEWLSRESENLLAVHRRMLEQGRDGAELALQAALALDPLLATVGPGTLRLTLLDGALNAAEKAAVMPALHVRALEARADANRALGRGQEAVADAQAALTLATSSGERDAVGRVLRGLAVLALAQGKLTEGRGLLERACALARETQQRREEGRALGLLGSVAALEGRLDVAASTLGDAIEVHREVGDLRFEVTNTGNLAVVAHDAGQLTEARAHCERALALCEEAGNRRLEAEVLGLLAAVHHEADQLDAARELYPRALSLHREVGNRRAEGMLLGYYGAFLAETGDVEGARAAYARALSILRESRDRPSEALVLGALAAIEAREGCIESARAALAHAMECIEGVDEPRARAAVHLWRGHLELALAREARREGDDSRAQMLLDAARRRLDQVHPGDTGEVRRAADVRLAMRALGRAVDAFGQPEVTVASTLVEGPPPGAPADALVVCARGRWFRSPGGEVVSIARWRPLQRLLERLAERREIAPGEPLTVDALVAAGWPGERMLPKAGATRVYTAIASLRRIGLRDMLVRDERGYLLRTDVAITRISGR